jgi:hypothetical protein
MTIAFGGLCPGENKSSYYQRLPCYQTLTKPRLRIKLSTKIFISIMKIFLFAFVFSVLALCVKGQDGSAVAARAYYQEVGFCNEDEFDLVYQLPSAGRQLRTSRSAISCSECRLDFCLGFLWSNCRVIFCSGCNGRRDLQERDQCDEVRDELEAKHVAALSSVSASCQETLATRNLDCYKVMEEKQAGSSNIHSLTLWNADTDVVVEENLVNGTSICENGYLFSFEAVAGADVKQVKFELYGLTDYNYIHTEVGAPFTMFAEEDRNIVGQKYKAGSYELIVSPDDDMQRKVGIEFLVKPSTHPDCDPMSQCRSNEYKGECLWNYQCRHKYTNNADRTVQGCNRGVCQCFDSTSTLGVCGCL